MDAAPLRLAEPDPQQVFPFLEPGSQRALAIPLADLNFWRGRADVVKNPGYLAMRFAIIDDPRYHSLFDLARARQQSPALCHITLLYAAAHAIEQPIPGVLAMGGRPFAPSQTWQRWWIPESWWQTHDAALRLVISAGWLVLADLADQELETAYGKVRREPRAHARARAPVDVDVDLTETETSTPDPSGEMPLPADVKRLRAELAVHLIQLTKANGHRQYPYSAGDYVDLSAAVGVALAGNRMPELQTLLEKTARWARNGGGFRTVLQKGGFIQ